MQVPYEPILAKNMVVSISQVEIRENRVRASVMKFSGAKHRVHIDGSDFEVSLPSSLSQPTINVDVQDSSYVIQVPTRDFAGNIRLRFEGTAFDLKVVPTECADYLQRMPEKPKPDVSKQVRARSSWKDSVMKCAGHDHEKSNALRRTLSERNSHRKSSISGGGSHAGVGQVGCRAGWGSGR